MSKLTKNTLSDNPQQVYIERIKQRGFLPSLDANKLKKLSAKLANVDENVLPTPLPEGGKPRGSWRQLFGQGNSWRNSNVCKLEDANEHGNADLRPVGIRPR